MSHPCLHCGACCATYRVSFHWSEAEPALGGQVPVALTESIRTHERAMRGTNQTQPRCIALEATIGQHSRCTIHAHRPTPCAQVAPSLERGQRSAQCDKARQAHGLPMLMESDWHGTPRTQAC